MTGQYAHNIDAKGRLFIPARLREELGQTFHVTIGMDHCLSIYSNESWDAFMEKLRELPYSKAKALRVLSANAQDVQVDAQGRILLPKHLLTYASLEKEALVLGAGNRAEIWNPAEYEKDVGDMDADAVEAAFVSLGF